jgi:pimeloyl-ACP methyl ester carboxylesterase
MSNEKLPLVFLPGQLCTELLWAPQLKAFPDLSQIVVQRDHDTVEKMAVATLDAMPERANLVCHAMGGFVAIEIMRRAPRRVANLVLMSTLAPADTPKQTVRREGYLRLVEEGKFDAIIEERLPILVHPDRMGDAVLTGVLRRMAYDTGADTFLKQQRAIMARPDSRPSLNAIPCPTLLIYGRSDGITTMEHQQQMLDAIPNARLEIVEGSGHMVTLEKPQAVNGLLSQFLGR